MAGRQRRPAAATSPAPATPPTSRHGGRPPGVNRPPVSCAGRSPAASTSSSGWSSSSRRSSSLRGSTSTSPASSATASSGLAAPSPASAGYVLPLILVAVGVSFIRSNRSSSPYRLVIGWSLVGLTALGVIHVASGPEGFSVNGVTDSGGVIGWVVGEPLRTLMAEFGSIVLLVALGIGGLLLITQASLRTIAQRTGRGAASIARPVGRAARNALGNLSSLTSDSDADHDDAADSGASAEAGVTTALALPAAGPVRRCRRLRCRRRRRRVAAPPEAGSERTIRRCGERRRRTRHLGAAIGRFAPSRGDEERRSG